MRAELVFWVFRHVLRKIKMFGVGRVCKIKTIRLSCAANTKKKKTENIFIATVRLKCRLMTIVMMMTLMTIMTMFG